MPRGGHASGWDPVPVCAFCVQFLTSMCSVSVTRQCLFPYDLISRPLLVTAGGKAYLRTQSIARLKAYIQAYGLRLGGNVIEKDDVIDAIMAVRVSALEICGLSNEIIGTIPCFEDAEWVPTPC